VSTPTQLIESLRQIVGAANVLTDGDLTPWVQDWRKRETGKALAVVRPGSTQKSRPWSKPAPRHA
jgi:hypothetical protein